MQSTPESKRILSLYEELIKRVVFTEKGPLRFNARLLPASVIANQYYCEKQVELAYVYGEVEERAERIIGKELHEELLKHAVKVRVEDILRKIFSGEFVIVREMLLIAEYKGVVVAGIPDAIAFDKGSPIYVFEYKFSKRTIPFRDYHVQTRLYCLLLNLMGFNTDNLRYALIIAPLWCKDNEKSRIILRKIPMLISRLSIPPREPVKFGSARVYINDFKIDEALEELEWAIGFWKRERNAKPTSRVAKCRVCEYYDVCDSKSGNN